MKKSQGKKSIHVLVPVELHDMLMKLCVDTGMTVTAIITQYLKHLKSKKTKNRIILDGQTNDPDFRLDARTTE